jgi:hypothetical protein
MPKQTRKATPPSNRQMRAMRITYDYLAAELKKAKRGEDATLTLRRARSAMNAISDVLHSSGASPSRRQRKPLGISRGELARSVLRDLREWGAWSTAAELAQSVAVMHGLDLDQDLYQRLEGRVSNACRSLERDGCLLRDSPIVPEYVPMQPRWRLPD